MSFIGGTKSTSAGQPSRAQRPGRGQPETATQCRALVALAPAAAMHGGRSPVYRPAAFLAHLIATHAQHPQTRERRRAQPEDAVQSYESGLAANSTLSGRNFSRAM